MTNQGSQTSDSTDTFGNHVPYYTSGGLIKKYSVDSDTEFTEYLIEVDSNTYITNDGESLFSFGELKTTVKKELIYVVR